MSCGEEGESTVREIWWYMRQRRRVTKRRNCSHKSSSDKWCMVHCAFEASSWGVYLLLSILEEDSGFLLLILSWTEGWLAIFGKVVLVFGFIFLIRCNWTTEESTLIERCTNVIKMWLQWCNLFVLHTAFTSTILLTTSAMDQIERKTKRKKQVWFHLGTFLPSGRGSPRGTHQDYKKGMPNNIHLTTNLGTVDAAVFCTSFTWLDDFQGRVGLGLCAFPFAEQKTTQQRNNKSASAAQAQ